MLSNNPQTTVRDTRFIAAKLFALCLSPPPLRGSMWNAGLLRRRAAVLLKAAEQVDLGDGKVRWYTDRNIAEQCGCSTDLVRKVRRLCVAEGLDGVLDTQSSKEKEDKEE